MCGGSGIIDKELMSNYSKNGLTFLLAQEILLTVFTAYGPG
jgi:hypothetical protein